MSAFIHTLKGRISSIDYGKKELSLLCREISSETEGENEMKISLDPHVRIINASYKILKFTELKNGKEVEIGYSTKKPKIIASLIKVLY